MSSSNSLSGFNANSSVASDPLASWKSIAENALKIRKKRASQEESTAETLRAAKSLQRLHPAASEAIKASLSPAGSASMLMTEISRTATFNRTLRSLAR